MTGRARWLLIMAVGGIAAGVTRQQGFLSLLSLAALIWVLLEWLRFRWYVWYVLADARCEKQVNGYRSSELVLWAGRRVLVEVALFTRAPVGPLATMEDIIPELFSVSRPMQAGSGQKRAGAQGWLRGMLDAPSWDSGIECRWSSRDNAYVTRIAYKVLPSSAGRVTLPGVRLVWWSSNKLFVTQRVIPMTHAVRVLPDFDRSSETSSTVKRLNVLPSHGIHRWRRAGTGGELLELREYVPGDPPKSIAWKASARRDQLMTRQYESEVPVRLEMLIDNGRGVYLGGFGKRLIDQLAYVAASVAQAAVRVGDPFRATLLDESQTRRYPWHVGDKGHMYFLRELSEASVRPPPVTKLTPQVLDFVIGLSQYREPDLWDAPLHWVPRWARPARRRRFRLAAVLASVLGLSVFEQYRCCYDDTAIADHIRQYLREAGVAWLPPFVDRSEIHKPVSPALIDAARNGLARVVTEARDNQVIVLLTSLPTLVAGLGTLVPVVKLALGRHHRVIAVCPTSTGSRPTEGPIRPAGTGVEELAYVAEQSRIRHMAHHVQKELNSLGVSVSLAGDSSATRLVLSEMELARRGERRAAKFALGTMGGSGGRT